MVSLSPVDHCPSGRRNGPPEKRCFQKAGEIRVGDCSLSRWTWGAKNPGWLCHYHGYKCSKWLFLEGSWVIVQHLHRLYQ